MTVKILKKSLVAFSFVTMAASAFSAHALTIQHEKNIPFVSGGIGIDERNELRALSDQFNLQIILALKSGDFISDAEVEIKQEDGMVVLKQASEGPQFFATLSPGKYNVNVSWQHIAKQKTVTITENIQEKAHFYWDGE